MWHKGAFTLAEVLITLAIIGIVAAVTIPSVVANYQQQQYKAGLKKAVSALNEAILMNIQLEGESPNENGDLYHYFQRRMNVIEKVDFISDMKYSNPDHYSGTQFNNSAFYTADGFRYEFFRGNYYNNHFPLHEDKTKFACVGSTSPDVGSVTIYNNESACGGCGSYGLIKNSKTKFPPCIITVDVNGDRKPNPANAKCKYRSSCVQKNQQYSTLSGKNLKDLFSIMITEYRAIPYGVAAQRAMYEN